MNSLSSTQKNQAPGLMESVAKATVVGAVGGFAGAWLFGGDGTLSLVGMDVSIPVALGVAIGSASFVGDYAAPKVLGLLPQSAGAVAAETMMLKPALTAAAAYGTVTLLLGRVEQPLQLMMLGAGSEVAGSYAYSTAAPLLGMGNASDDAPEVATY
jgi:hypothetical protein